MSCWRLSSMYSISTSGHSNLGFPVTTERSSPQLADPSHNTASKFEHGEFRKQRRRLPRGRFTHRRHMPSESLSMCMESSSDRASRIRPLRDSFDLSDTTSDAIDLSFDDTTEESDDFYDFENLDTLDQAWLPQGIDCRDAADNATVKAMAVSELNHHHDSLTEFLPDAQELSGVSEPTNGIPPWPKQELNCQSSRPATGSGKPSTTTNAFRMSDCNNGRDAIKYWPSPSLSEAFHLSEAIIKFTRDVEAAKSLFE